MLTGADVCIVGGGFAGQAVASEVTRHGGRCLVLDLPSGERWPTVSFTGDADFDIEGNRAPGLGGTSQLWNGVASPLEAAATARWPIPGDELTQWVQLANVWLGVGDHPATSPLLPQHVRAATTDRLRFAMRQGQPVRLASLHPTLRDNPLLTVLDVGAAAFVQPRRRGRAPTVTIRPTGGDELRISAGAIVIACGVLESVRLLAASGTRRRGALGNSTGMLGCGINAHPRIRQPIPRPAEWRGLGGVLRSEDLGTRFAAKDLNLAVLDINAMDETTVMVDVTVEQEPLPTNRVTWTRDRMRGPLLQCTSSLSPRDNATLDAARATVNDVATALSGRPPSLPATVRWFHPAGGCAMSVTPETGVVDGNGRLHDASGIYVAGASTLPRSGAANPTVTVTALGLRLGRHLSGLR